MTATHCPYCALQCGMDVSSTGKVDARNFVVNKGSLCRKGWTAGSLLDHPDRLTTPLIRSQSGALEPATWEEALDQVASRVIAVQQAGGREAVAVS